MIIVVAGWQGASPERHAGFVSDRLWQCAGDVLGDSIAGPGPTVAPLIVHGGNPRGGVDRLAENAADSFAWPVQSWHAHRDGRLLGSRVGPYRKMFARTSVDLLVVFYGPGDVDTREAVACALRHRVSFRGFPLPDTGR